MAFPWAIVPSLLGFLGGMGDDEQYIPQERKSFETYGNADPRTALATHLGNLQAVGGGLAERLAQPIDLGVGVQDSPYFYGGPMPFPMGLTGSDPGGSPLPGLNIGEWGANGQNGVPPPGIGGVTGINAGPPEWKQGPMDPRDQGNEGPPSWYNNPGGIMPPAMDTVGPPTGGGGETSGGGGGGGMDDPLATFERFARQSGAPPEEVEDMMTSIRMLRGAA